MKLMKKLSIQFAILLSVIFTFSCEIDEPINPNQPNLYGPGGVLENPTRGKLNELVIGTLASVSTQVGILYDVAGIIGRDIYRFDTADPRYVGDLMGTGNLDNSAFYTNNSYAQRYASIKTCNVIIAAGPNTPGLSTAELQGYLAFAKTFKAFELLNALNHQYANGIRIDVEDEDNLGPFTSGAGDALTEIAGVLAEAATHCDGAGTAFPFNLTSGFNRDNLPATGDEFNTPSTFAKFIKGLQARVELYRGNYSAALTFVNSSFIDETGNFGLGVYRLFANAAGDRVNPLFFPRNTNGTTRLAHPTWLSQAVPGDLRLAKAQLRTNSISTAGLTATHDAFLYSTNTTPVAIIRNEELILIKAEALVQTDQFAAAKVLIDKIRVDAGNIGAYTGTLDKPSMITEVLFQRRYSLWDEGHRWVDMRRYNRLNELTIDRPGDSIIPQLPRPFNEIGVQGG
jgi:hypothetical protein